MTTSPTPTPSPTATATANGVRSCPAKPAPVPVPAAICGSFYACVSTCPNWPNVATHTHKHTRTHISIHTHTLLVSQMLHVRVCVSGVGVAAGQSPSCVMHPSNGEQAQWDRPRDK